MKCMCLPKLLGFMETLEARAIEMNALVPELPSIPQLPQAAGLTQLAGGLASLSSASSLSSFGQLPELAGMASGLQLPSATELAKLESMAFAADSFGLNLQGPNAAAQLSMTVGSLNVNAPTLKRLEELIPPLLGPLASLQSVAVTVDSVEASFGVNLLTEGAMPALGAKLSAIDVSGIPSVDPSELGDLAMLGRLANASGALGIDLNSVGGVGKLERLIDQTSRLDVPALTLTPPELTNMIGLMLAFGAVNGALSTSLMAPNAVDQLSASLPKLAANLDRFEANLTSPALPSVPDVPSVPGGTGGLPSMPSLPAKPETPGMPSMPVKPDVPGLPSGGGMPSIPGTPSLPGGGMPEKPGLPSRPTLPSVGSLGAPGGGLPPSLGLSADKTAALSAAAQMGPALAGAAPAMAMDVKGLAGKLPSVGDPAASLSAPQLPVAELPSVPSGMAASLPSGGVPTGGLPSGGLSVPGRPSGRLPQGLPASGLPLGNLPNMQSLSLAATFCNTFEGATGIALPTQMPACPNMFCIAKR